MPLRFNPSPLTEQRPTPLLPASIRTELHDILYPSNFLANSTQHVAFDRSPVPLCVASMNSYRNSLMMISLRLHVLAMALSVFLILTTFLHVFLSPFTRPV